MSTFSMENRVRKTQERLKQIGHLGRSNKEKISSLYESFFSSLTPPPRMDLDNWMDEFMFLPSESASEHGRFRTSRFPFLRKPAKKLSPSSPAKQVGCMKGAQLAFTTLGVGWHLYIADQCPAPSMFVQPTGEGISDWSEQKLEPTIRVTPKVSTSLGEQRPKHLSNKKLRKYYPGGYLAMASANSPMQMRSKSIRFLDIDEEDACNQDVGKEGSSVYLAIRRTANFGDSKIFRNSTPLAKETSSIEPFCNSGTAEHFLVPCPECNKKADKNGSYFEIKWENIKWENNDPTTAKCCCTSCGSLIDEYHKTWMLENAMWYRYNPTPLKKFSNDEKRAKLLTDLEKHGYNFLTSEDRDYIERTSLEDDLEPICTFFISSLYSPLGFYSWVEAVNDFITATHKKDKTLLKAFYNTVLGLTWSESVSAIDYKGLKQRTELYDPYGKFDIPWDALVLTMGIDVQKDRLEAHIIATGKDDEEWVVDYKVWYGDTAILGNNNFKFKEVLTCWGELYEYLHSKWLHESGNMLGLDASLIDARYRSPQVFQFCKIAKHLNIKPVHGKEGWGQGYIERPTKVNRYGVMLFKAFTDELKVKLYSQLENEPGGPNSIHFSKTIDYPTLYWKGLVIEELKTKRVGGVDVLYWENPPGGRNEPEDTYCYAKAAFLACRPNLEARKAMLSGTIPKPKKRRRKKAVGGVQL